MKPVVLVFICFVCLSATAQTKRLYINQPQYGKASFYGKKFDGRKTANGEIFGNANLTAAHRTYPMNSIVRITVQKNRRYVYCRINDRGPFVKGRIIDLTDAATIGLDFVHAGTEDVEVRLCEEIQLTRELETNFNSGDWYDCLGNKTQLKGKSISVGVMLSLPHALYIANDLYDDAQLHDIAIKAISVGPFKRYLVVIHNLAEGDVAPMIKLLYNRGYVNAKKY